VALQDEEQILRFRVAADGGLKPSGQTPMPGGPAPLALGPDGRTLYCGLRGTPALVVMSVEGDGRLAEAARTPLDADPCYVGVDRTGRYVLCAYFGAGMISVHRVGDGEPRRTYQLQTHKGAHMINADPSNRYVLVPHRDPDLILQFRLDHATGRLEPSDPPYVATPKNAGPRHYVFHPGRDVVYVSNEFGCSVSAYAFDSTQGTLALKQTLPTLPEGFEGKNSCAQIHITPNGRFLYVSNRGHDSVAGFRVDQETGLLAPAGNTATEPIPRAFAIDQDGAFLYAAGRDSGRMGIYRIDPTNGSLEQTGSVATGQKALWVLPVRL
jgi:6-phosphogluconolactonase